MDAGLELHASFIVGTPGDSPETLSATMDFVRLVNPTVATFNVMEPRPGTDVYADPAAVRHHDPRQVLVRNHQLAGPSGLPQRGHVRRRGPPLGQPLLRRILRPGLPHSRTTGTPCVYPRAVERGRRQGPTPSPLRPGGIMTLRVGMIGTGLAARSHALDIITDAEMVLAGVTAHRSESAAAFSDMFGGTVYRSADNLGHRPFNRRGCRSGATEHCSRHRRPRALVHALPDREARRNHTGGPAQNRSSGRYASVDGGPIQSPISTSRTAGGRRDGAGRIG